MNPGDDRLRISELGAIPIGLSLSVIHDARGRWLRELHEGLQDGVKWPEAIGQYWTRVAGLEPPTWPPRSGGVNWHWLTDLDSLGRVVDFGSPFGDLAFLFEAEGANVVYCAASSLHLEVTKARIQHTGSKIGVAAPNAEGSRADELADLAVVMASEGWAARVARPLAHHVPDLHWAIRFLRPGGWLAVLLPNPWSIGVFRAAWRSGEGVDLSGLARIHRLGAAVEGMGFSCVRPYYVLPDIGQPETFVPRTSAAVRTIRPGRDGHLGRITDWLHPLFFPGILLLARK